MNLRKAKSVMFVACICLISSLFFGTVDGSEGKPIIQDEEKFYHVTEVEVLSKPEDLLCCALRFSEPAKSLNTLDYFKKISSIVLTQPYRIDSKGGVQIKDLREISQWLSINQPSLTYVCDFENGKKTFKGRKENIFHPFLSSNNEMLFGKYRMNVEFDDLTGLQFSFSRIAETK